MESLTRQLDAFEAGYLREAANLWEHLEQRDDLLRTVISKRKKAVARQGWTVLLKPNLPEEAKAEAQEHAAALEHFYNHLECEHGVDTAERGGFKLLARQMMDAVGKRFAVHEITWRPESTADRRRALAAGRATNRRLVTASFRFVPLSFFENTTGRLRFLASESELTGRDLAEGGWLITVGEGLMFASSVTWMFKHLALDDWAAFSQANARPVLRGASSAAAGSADWEKLEAALRSLMAGEPVVHGANEEVSIVDLTGGNGVAFQRMVERADRLLAAIWRGADLSTLSRDRGYGASLQEKESCVLEEDDADMLTEALHRYVDQWVIRHVFGEGVKPLAMVKVLSSPRECTTHDLQVDQFLLQHGAPLSLEATLHRYGRTAAHPGERTLLSLRPTRQESPHAATTEPALSGSAAGLNNMGKVDFPGGSMRELSEPLPPEAPSEDGQANQALLPSAEGPFTILQPDWVQLAPYGDFPHSRGLQRVDRAAAETMVAAFNSFLGKAARLFGGVPFYAGHPDLPGAGEHADRKAYGWITELEARDDGLYGFAKWSDTGRELLQQAHYKYLSPYWEAREIARENGQKVFRPVALISVGLTNQPNIPVRPLANEDAAGDTSTPSLEPEVVEVLEGALSAGRITPAQESEWLAALQNDLAAGRERLEAQPPCMLTRSRTGQLGLRKAELIGLPDWRNHIQEAVARKQTTGLSYDDAWQAVKREHPAWFE